MKLKINSNSVSGFHEWAVLSSMETLSDVFICSSPNSTAAKLIQAGASCEVYLSEKKELAGRVDSISLSSVDNLVVWEGRDSTGNLVDSHITHPTMEWKGLTAKEIIQSIASPFGISVEGIGNYQFKKFNAERTATCGEVIAEICSTAGIIASSTDDGNIMLASISTKRAPIILEEGRNIAEYKFKASVSSSFSSFTILGQASFNSVDLASATQPIGIVQSPGNWNLRPFIGINSGLTDYQVLLAQAEWIMRDSISKIEHIEVTVIGIQDVFPNTLIYLKSESMGIDGIRLVAFTKKSYKKGQGEKTTLTLVNPYKYGANLEPISDWIAL